MVLEDVLQRDLAVELGVQGDEDGPEAAAGGEVVGQGMALVAGPGLEGGDELDLIDQAVLQREQSEEEVTVGFGGHDGAPGRGATRCRVKPVASPRRRGPGWVASSRA